MLLMLGCASHPAAPPAAPVDLAPAKQAVENARAAGAEAKAPQGYAQAVEYLRQAEAAAGEADPAASSRAECLTKLAVAGAQCAMNTAQLTVVRPVAQSPSSQGSGSASRAELADLRSRLEASQAEKKRLEEHVALLERERDILNREILRTKSRLKGAATSEEVSSAIAEARILASRVPPGAGPLLARCNESIDKASSEFKSDNLETALFFALEAQEEASGAGASTSPGPSATLKKSYTVKSPANLRAGPGTGEAVLQTLAAGSQVSALGAQGEWVHVQSGTASGWVHRDLLE
jgi:hypothetical protein